MKTEVLPKADSQFDHQKFLLSEIEHKYGSQVHILSDPFLLSHLAQLCSETTTQPIINELITTLYLSLLKLVVNHEFPTRQTAVRTRMAQAHPEAVLQSPMIDPEVPVVTVSLARAGTVPSQICYNSLNYFMNPKTVRQDHIAIGRKVDEKEMVTGSQVAGFKIGGNVDGSIVLFPDPMGATGSTIIEALDLYKNRGKALKFIAVHCIVTPEYLKKVQKHHPDLIVFAIRLDRGLSPIEVLNTVPGTHWDLEKGLNHKHYIVPGGGGFGEIMNNAYV